MYAAQHKMLGSGPYSVDAFGGRAAPGHDHDVVIGVESSPYNLLCELLPALVSMRIRVMGIDGETGIEHQDSLLGPLFEETVFWDLEVIRKATA